MSNLKNELKRVIPSFIEKRLIVTRDINLQKYKDDELITADGYLALYAKYEECLDDIRSQCSNLDDDKEEYADLKVRYERMCLLKEDLQSRISRTILSDDNIKEIVTLIKRYFDIVDMDKFVERSESVSENFFLRGILWYILDHDPSNADVAKKYLNYFYSGNNAGINSTLSGRISVGYFDEITLSNCDSINVFSIDTKGNIIKPYDKLNDTFILGKDIYFALVKIGGEEFLLPVMKVKDKRKTKYNYFFQGKFLIEKPDVIEDEVVQIYASLKDTLELMGLGSHYEEVYNKEDFNELIKFVRSYANLDDERRKKIDEVASISAAIWLSLLGNVSASKLDIGKVGEIDFDELIRYVNSLASPQVLSGEEFVSLANSIKDTVTMLLITRGIAVISVDYHPNYELQKCIDKASVNGDFMFPLKTSMIAKENEITLRMGQSAPEVTVFKRDFEQPNDGNGRGRNL